MEVDDNMVNSSEQSVKRFASELRKEIISIADTCGGNGHWGGSMSCVEILATLYSSVLNTDEPDYNKKNKLIMSKGHCAIAQYAAMKLKGIITAQQLSTFQQNGSDFPEHPIMNQQIGIECSGGSLGLGMPMAAGMALGAKLKNLDYKIYSIVGDGECDEGSIWEAFMFASQHKLDNLTVIIDSNGYQSDGKNEDILSMSNLNKILTDMGWKCISVDGHDCGQLLEAFNSDHDSKPKVIIADTVKGKGISFMENDNTWHHRTLKGEELEKAKSETERDGNNNV